MMCKQTCFSVRDGALVADFKDAVVPMVWRMDLSRVHAAGFRVIQNGSSWELTIEGPKGESSVIAAYASADRADRALRRLSCALRRSGTGSRWLSRLGVLALVAIVGFALFYGAPRLLDGGVLPGPAPAQQAQGQAQSADQVLRAPSVPPGRP